MYNQAKHEDGKAGLLLVMSSLGIVSSEAGSVFEQHGNRRRKLKEQAQERKKTTFIQQKNKALERYSGESYFPGILSSAAGPSGDMGSVPRIRSSEIDSFSIDQFVVLPYGLKWFASQVVNVSTESNEIEVRYFVSSDGYKSFIESDEPKFWEFSSRILMKLSDPQLVRTSSTRFHYTFSEKDIAKAKTAFAQWRRTKKTRKV